MPLQVELNTQMEQIIQQAVTNALLTKLDRVLPDMVSEILTQKDSWNKSYIGSVLRAAVKRHVEQITEQFMAEKEQGLRVLVREHLEKAMSPEAVAEHVVESLKAIKVSVQPFVKAKAKILNEDEDD